MDIIAFVNPGSGGNQGGRVLQLLKNHLGDENVFDIKEDKGPDRGLTDRAADPDRQVAVIVAGGDGTFSWVANAVEKKELTHCHLAVIPLGSGNDMSRCLGWGKKFPGLPVIEKWMTHHVVGASLHRLDVWRLNAKGANGESGYVDEDGIEHGARPLVCNYLSLGADAFVELRFNQLRWNNPDRYKSRLGNLKAHFLVGVKYMCSSKSKKIHVVEHIESLVIDGKQVDIPENLQALIFLNIPSYGAGTQPWGFLGSQKPSDVNSQLIVDDMYVDDHRFEVIGLKNLSQFGLMKAFGTHGIRVAQGQSMTLKLKSDSTPFQVDGEPWEQRGGEVTLEPGNPVGVLRGPYWKKDSRRNAKFDPDEDEDVAIGEEAG